MDDNVTYTGIAPRDKDLLTEVMVSTPPIIGVDTETISLEDKTMIGLAIAFNEYDSFWFRNNGSIFFEMALRLLHNPNITKVFHNSKFDFDVFERNNFPIDHTNFEDSEILAYTLNMPQKLYNLAASLGFSIPIEYFNFDIPKGTTMLDKPMELICGKCGLDSRLALKCWNRLKDQVTESYQIDRDLVDILRGMETRGVKVNEDCLTEFYYVVGGELDFLRQIIQTKGCDPASNLQVGQILAQRGHRLPLTKSRKQYRVDDTVLSSLTTDPFAQSIRIYREKAKLQSTYIEPLLNITRVHTSWNNTRVVTGRLSSSDPNMQNIPDFFRVVFIADDMFYSLDANQIELRVVAWLAQDPVLLSAFMNGEDVHLRTMKEMGITDRRVAKILNFGVLYGGDEYTIMENAKKQGIMITPQEARNFVIQYFDRMKKVREWIEYTRSLVHSSGVVRTMFGRIRKVPYGVDLTDRKQAVKVEREMINMPVQGSAAEIVKKAMVKTKNYDLRIQVHDELLFDGACPGPQMFGNLAPFPTPFELKVGKNWGEMEKISGYGKVVPTRTVP